MADAPVSLRRSLDHSDSTRFYGSVEGFQRWTRSQSDRSATKTTTTVPPTMKNAKRGSGNSTELVNRRKIRLLRTLLGNSGLEEEEMAWRRLAVILIALDCFVLFRRLFCLYEKLESLRRCLRKHHIPPPPPPHLPSKVCGNFEEGRTNPKTAAEPTPGGSAALSTAGSGDFLDEEEDSVAFDNGPASYHPPSISLFDEKSRIENENIACCSNFIMLENFLRTLWNGIADASVIPELVAVAVVTTLVLTGVTVLSRKMETLDFDGDNTWPTWTKRREGGNQNMEFEGKIIAELVYLDATIGHLCTGR